MLPRNMVFLGVCFGLVGLGCGEQTAAQTDAVHNVATVQSPLRLHAPSLLSGIYEKACTEDEGCTLVPVGDVCRCQSWGSVATHDAMRFVDNRHRLGARCANKRAAVCTVDPLQWVARCQKQICMARPPEDRRCVPRLDTVSRSSQLFALERHDILPWQQHTRCWQAQRRGYRYRSLGLHILMPGKYRFDVSKRVAHCAHARGLVLVTPDCQGPDVACRWCDAEQSDCVLDLQLDADARVMVLEVDACPVQSLSVGRWDPARPFRPPMPVTVDDANMGTLD